MERERGFSLFELMIVVAIVLIIAVIAIPNLMRARISANESSAVQTVRQIATAELTYHNSYSNIGFAPDLKSLGGPAVGCSPSPAGACVVDSVVTNGVKSGYLFFCSWICSRRRTYQHPVCLERSATAVQRNRDPKFLHCDR